MVALVLLPPPNPPPQMRGRATAPSPAFAGGSTPKASDAEGWRGEGFASGTRR
jgi:hypothetical protein